MTNADDTGFLAGFEFIGHAIVSADGKIADENGNMPESLFVEADWQAFQKALDESDLVVLGRKGHAWHPNPGRKRLVLTRSVSHLTKDEADPLSHFWNPDQLTLPKLLKELGLTTGKLAITGGKGVFDYFKHYLTAFELVECQDTILPGGVDCFTDSSPREALEALGLKPGDPRIYDEIRGVVATRWS